MTTRTPIQQRFEQLQHSGHCALMPFLMAGDPDLATTRRVPLPGPARFTEAPI